MSEDGTPYYTGKKPTLTDKGFRELLRKVNATIDEANPTTQQVIDVSIMLLIQELYQDDAAAGAVMDYFLEC
jgi:hypothetical protein